MEVDRPKVSGPGQVVVVSRKVLAGEVSRLVLEQRPVFLRLRPSWPFAAASLSVSTTKACCRRVLERSDHPGLTRLQLVLSQRPASLEFRLSNFPSVVSS